MASEESICPVNLLFDVASSKKYFICSIEYLDNQSVVRIAVYFSDTHVDGALRSSMKLFKVRERILVEDKVVLHPP